MKKTYTTPGGQYFTLYRDILGSVHTLIAGASGSGKSVALNSVIHTALLDSPAKVEFIMIDVKRVELGRYRNLPHVIKYASEPGEPAQALQYALALIEQRYREMQKSGALQYNGSNVYIVIDELADLMTTDKKNIQPLLQRICQIGRAANIHVIACTQCPLREVIPTAIKVNFDTRLALRTSSAQDSRNIIGVAGCENFPDPRRAGRAEGIYKDGANLTHYDIPTYTEEERQRVLNYWRKNHKPRLKWF